MNSDVKTVAGSQWRFTKLSAVTAREIDEGIIFSVEARVGSVWVKLDDPDLVNKHVPNWEVLMELESVALEYNFGFLDSWRPARLPAKMLANYTPMECRHIDGLFSSLISANLATLNELKTVYSLEEAFKLLEVLTVSKVNEFLATEK